VSHFFRDICGDKRLRQGGFMPALTDPEAITIEIFGEIMGKGSDKEIYDYTRTHWGEWFPKLGSRSVFVRQTANLWRIKQLMMGKLSAENTQGQDLYLCDGFPMPICHPKRVRRHKTDLAHDAAFGFCAAKDLHYFGFKGHILTTQKGAIKGFEMTPANGDERPVLQELCDPLEGGDIFADKGLISTELTQILAAKGINLHTPLRKNMPDQRPPEFVSQIMNVRRKVETVIGQLVSRFSIQSIRAKTSFTYQAKVIRKLLAHSIAFSLTLSISPDNPLQFDNLFTYSHT
jgi:hypothetical protein